VSGGALVLSLVFGCIGVGYYRYGRKQLRFAPLLAGVGLMVFPYFISNLYATLGTGAVLMALPLVLDF